MCSWEIQVAEQYRSVGLGRFLMELLSRIGQQWSMDKVMLTVFKRKSPSSHAL